MTSRHQMLFASAITAVPGSSTFINGASGNFTVPVYNTLTIELWGGGAPGGVTSEAAGNGNPTTVSTFSLTANGGTRSTATVPNATSGSVGGTASGGNTTNTAGAAGASPNPLTTAQGNSGKGGDCPNGGVGGAQVTNAANTLVVGVSGQVPGGGGSGRNAGTGVGTWDKYPGGAAGGYVKHILTRSGGGPAIGSLIAYATGGQRTANAGTNNGNGAYGQVKFTWT